MTTTRLIDVTLQQLMLSAEKSCEWRGHDLGPWQGEKGSRRRSADCQTCGMGVSVNASPPPNGIAVGGEAVALDCPVRP